MDKIKLKEILEKYGLYYEAIEKLGQYPISYTPTIEELKLSRKVILRAYKEMNEIKFGGNLIDYLCFISMGYIVSEWWKEIDTKGTMSMMSLPPHETQREIIKKWKAYGHAFFHLEAILYRNRNEARNATRLFFKNPKFFLDSNLYNYYKKLFVQAFGKGNEQLLEILCARDLSKIFLNVRLRDYLGVEKNYYNAPQVLHKMMVAEIYALLKLKKEKPKKAQQNTKLQSD